MLKLKLLCAVINKNGRNANSRIIFFMIFINKLL
jgi:hypothetical protein